MCSCDISTMSFSRETMPRYICETAVSLYYISWKRYICETAASLSKNCVSFDYFIASNGHVVCDLWECLTPCFRKYNILGIWLLAMPWGRQRCFVPSFISQEICHFVVAYWWSMGGGRWWLLEYYTPKKSQYGFQSNLQIWRCEFPWTDIFQIL